MIGLAEGHFDERKDVPIVEVTLQEQDNTQERLIASADLELFNLKAIRGNVTLDPFRG